jgi:FtsP/CotA-like multicopper oxidase with cupredoxin domain
MFLFLSGAARAEEEMCPPRPVPGSVIADPPQLSSRNGSLTVDFVMLNSVGPDGIMRYCYVYGDGTTEAPTLLANPGDLVTIRLTNRLTATTDSHVMAGPAGPDPCKGGSMSSASTNLHFHGLNIPPACHQDEVIKTSIQPNAPPFTYSFRIPANEPPGLYWYHPHPHGFTKTQVIGGAAGALIVGGVENLRPEAAGLPQRVLVIRQQMVSSGDEDSILSVNFVPFQKLLYGRILVTPGQSEMWRILNASSTQFLQLQLLNQGVPTTVQLIGLDGVPLDSARNVTAVVIPPAGRAEIIIPALPQNGLFQLFNAGFDTGPIGDSNPAVLLANIVPDQRAPAAAVQIPATTQAASRTRFVGLDKLTPTTQRKLYFSESADGTQFFITVNGQKPRVYDPGEPPAITTRQGAVEDWTIENRSTEVHAFHLHQLHFVLREINGVPTNDSALRDTIVVPYWDGQSRTYPSVKLRIDFRDPETVGTFLYHCHILDHEDGGMMAKIKVVPAK